MKLRNKKTGEIDDVSIIHSANKIKGVVEHEDGVQCLFAYTLKEFNEEWEDAREEPKKYWFIENDGHVSSIRTDEDFAESLRASKDLGNYFETKEEAEKAVEKLKAWKRLKDKGFNFEYVGEYENLCGNGFEIPITAIMPPEAYTDVEVRKNLDFLFGGEE